ncbi:hypothetical protein [Tianweitania sediminis]|uniref:Glyoxalase/bleomycin resistance protein/dioxygenase n=1 Tax=Tianweitania sediminis TaxID=1502156 RepID=A0A8J7UID9_9HYPH|nr:hypothetical protein [Tianweitania sediminis]MBP0437700.1 hypothetical protein [Tianweitania sediminis]
MIEQDHISFGPVHLEVTDLSRTSMFWERLFGFVSRTGENDSVEIGAASETLIVLHAGARHPPSRETVVFITWRSTRRTNEISRVCSSGSPVCAS